MAPLSAEELERMAIQQELEAVVCAETQVRETMTECSLKILGQILYHANYSVIGADPEVLFKIFDMDEDGRHNYMEAKIFEEVTGGSVIEPDDWIGICKSVRADPAAGLSFADYAKLYNAQEQPDAAFVGQAMTARINENDFPVFDESVTSHGFPRLGVQLYSYSAPTGALLDSSLLPPEDDTLPEAMDDANLAAVADVHTDYESAVMAALDSIAAAEKPVPLPPEEAAHEASARKQSDGRRRGKKKTGKQEGEAKKGEGGEKEGEGKKKKRTTKGLRTTHLKTQLCRNWLQGSCSYGDECGFAHGGHELVPQPEAKD